MITEAHLDSPSCLSFDLANPRNMNIRSSKLRFRVTFVTFACLPRERAGRTEYLSGKKRLGVNHVSTLDRDWLEMADFTCCEMGC